MKKLLLTLIVLSGLLACQNKTKKEVKEETKQKETSSRKIDFKVYKTKGKEIAMETFKIFKANIEKTGKEKGLPEVVSFCHDNAEKLTDSLSKIYGVEMKRVSHRLRNQDNKPNVDEKAIIENYLAAQEDHKELTPIVMKDEEGFVHFYAPIKIKEKCLQCHGIPSKDIKAVVLKKIKKHYPEDKATGFRLGELRGIWDIRFKKE